MNSHILYSIEQPCQASGRDSGSQAEQGVDQLAPQLSMQGIPTGLKTGPLRKDRSLGRDAVFPSLCWGPSRETPALAPEIRESVKLSDILQGQGNGKA